MRKNKNIPLKGKPKFAFVVDGECEFWYIQMLKRNEKLISIDLEPKIPQKKTISEQFKQVEELARDYDKVFWIIDFDVILRETREAKNGKETALQAFKKYYRKIGSKYKNVSIIVNNPCLEYWLLLHYQPTSRPFDACEGVTKELKKHLTTYEKKRDYYTKQGNDIYLRLKPHLTAAISNAKKLNQFDFSSPHSAVSEMPLLFEIDEIKNIISPK